jgi:ABC-2 type transport system permease protein
LDRKAGWIINIFFPLLLVGWAQQWHYRWDATHDQRYTLNQNTTRLLEELSQPLKIDVFLSGTLPSEYLRLQRETRALIRSMEQHTDRLIVSFIDPFEEAESTESLIREMNQFGLPPEYVTAQKNQTVAQSVVFPWAIVNDGNKTLRIPLLEKVLGDDGQEKINRSIAQLEYHYFDALFKITQKQKPTLAVLTSHGCSEAVKIADLMRSLQPYYQLASFDLKALEGEDQKTLENLNRFPLLLISNPTEAFTEKEKFLLDQHLMGGGKQWWAIHPVAINRDSLFNAQGEAMAVARSLNMENAFFKYGIRLQNNLVQDLYCAPVVLASGAESQTQYLPYPWPFYPLAKPFQNDLFGGQMGNVLMPFPSAIDTLKNALQKTVLLGSSNFSQSLATPLNIKLATAAQKLSTADFDQKSQPMGVLLRGIFSSAFENRIHPALIEGVKTSGTSEMVVFSSGSIAENQVDKGNPLELGYDKWTNNFYSNKIFVQQTIHHLMGNEMLLNIKNKSLVLPRLDQEKVEQHSPKIKIILLVLPLLILGGLWMGVRRWRKIQYGQ